jgi:hypothetical protein
MLLQASWETIGRGAEQYFQQWKASNHLTLKGTGVSNTCTEFSVGRKLFQRLNEQQRAAVFCPVDRPLLVAAGPGSGKTSAMIARMAHLIQQVCSLPGLLACLHSACHCV